jgi:hypothetical protein
MVEVDSGTYSPETLDARRRLALAMLQQNQTGGPIASPLQGISKVLGQVIGSYRMAELDKEEKAAKKADNAAFLSALGLGDALPSVTPGVRAQISPPSSPGTRVASLGGQPVMNDAVSLPSVNGSGISDDTVTRLIGTESGGDANAKNPKSSATGAGQFIASTWLSTVKKHAPNIANGKTDQELLALRTNGPLSREMTAAYARDNADILANAGYESTPGNVKLAHFAGPGTAVKVLRAADDTPVRQIMSPAAILANPFLRNWNAGQLRAWADKQMGGETVRSAQAPSETTTDAGGVVAPTTKQPALAGRLAKLLQTSNDPATQQFARQGLIKLATRTADKPANVQEYEYAVGQGYNKTYNDWLIEQKQAGRTQITNTVGAGETSLAKSTGEEVGKNIVKSRDSAAAAASGIGSLNETRSLLDSSPGVITGAGANIKLATGRWLATLGLIKPGSTEAETIANTEAFGASQATAVLDSIKTLGANPSNADRDYLEKAKAGSIEMTEPAIRRVLDIGERVNRQAIKAHNDRVKKLGGSVAQFGLDVEEPAAYERKVADPDQPRPVKTERVEVPRVGSTVGADGLGGLPDGAVIKDGSGKRFRMQGGTPIPLE